jgi:hypothetical protein
VAARFLGSPHLVMFWDAADHRPPTIDGEPAAWHPNFDFFIVLMLTLFVHSRPGRLPDRQLVLGGMLVPLTVRAYPARSSDDATLPPVVGVVDDADTLQLYCLEHGIQVCCCRLAAFSSSAAVC